MYEGILWWFSCGKGGHFTFLLMLNFDSEERDLGTVEMVVVVLGWMEIKAGSLSQNSGAEVSPPRVLMQEGEGRMQFW